MKRFSILAIAILMVVIAMPVVAQSTIGELFIKNHSSFVINFYLDGAFIGTLQPLTESHMMIATGDHTISGVCANNSNSTWGPSQFTMTIGGFIQNFWDNTVAAPQMTWFKVINRTVHTITSIKLDDRTLDVNVPPQTESTIQLSVGSHVITAYGSDGAWWGPFTFWDTINGWNWTLTDN